MTKQEFDSFNERLEAFREKQLKELMEELDKRPELKKLMYLMVGSTPEEVSRCLDIIEMLKEVA